MRLWLRKMLSREPAPAPESSRLELARARVNLREASRRADVAIEHALEHADELFGPTRYRGPERRRVPR